MSLSDNAARWSFPWSIFLAAVSLCLGSRVVLADPASALWDQMKKDSEGLYLTHIPEVFSIHSIRVFPGIAYAGTVRDPGGWVHVTRNHDPNRDMVLEQIAPDTLRFLIAPSDRRHPAGFSFATRTGCFTLRARQTPSGRHPRIHLNGYGPQIKAFPIVFCGNGPHVRVEWQGPLPKSAPLISRVDRKTRKYVP